MKNNESLGDRMKRYESVSKTRLVSRMPVIIRLDGIAFHTFTHGFIKPFDEVLMKTMQDTMKYLCENIQGCVFGYTQSDEITLILIDYAKLNTSAWFDNEVQKLCSVAASMATSAFNSAFLNNAEHFILPVKLSIERGGSLESEEEVMWQRYDTYRKVFGKALFDCRAFNVPKEDVCNCILWRQKDAERNSIQSLSQAHFSHKEILGLNNNKLQDKLHEEKGINWNDLDIVKKRGTCCIKKPRQDENTGEIKHHSNGEISLEWVIDTEIPIFTKNRNYIEQLIFI